MTHTFICGPLLHMPLLQAVLGGPVDATRKATLPGHRLATAPDRLHPVILRDPASEIRGALIDTSDARLAYYLAVAGWSMQRGDVSLGDETVSADLCLPSLARRGGNWDQAHWTDRLGAISVVAVDEIMEGLDMLPADIGAARYPQMLARAASTVRAATNDIPWNLRLGRTSDTVTAHKVQRPYTHYFSLIETDLQFPRYDGTQSETVNRAALISADAITVVPYDPVRDRVLIIEQFRYGPYLRGDIRPWVLEPVAGRIDAGETADEAVRRELQEEAGLTAGELIPVLGYYPSPGAWTEYIYIYVALADLPDEAAGIAGLAEEAEDIRSHVLDFDAAMDLISSGEADTGPLILTLMWLQNKRAELRGRA